ncbi:MAG: hypothetical protein RMJ75_03430 [Nitrososphaerota archaeon]|nr:hypothetical protein [Nitrososphaerota archaeon]
MLTLTLLSLPVTGLSQAEKTCGLLIGYSGNGFLPFVDGGDLSFAVGEQLYVLSPSGGSTVFLTDPQGRKDKYVLTEKAPTLLREFARGDGGVWRLLLDDGCEMTLVVSERGSLLYGVITVEKDTHDQLILNLQGPPYLGFRVEEPADDRSALRAKPGGELLLDVGRPFRFVVLYLLYPDRFTISGKVSGTPFTYTIDPLVGVYRYDRPVRGTVVPVRLPELGRVGQGGIFPLRYGTYSIRLVGATPDGQTFTGTFTVEVAPFEFRVPRLSTYRQLNVNELRDGIRLVYLNYETGTMESINLNLPLYEVKVVDAVTGQTIDYYSFNVEGFVSVRDGAVTVLVPQRFDFREIRQVDDALTVTPSVTVGGIDVSDAIGEVTLYPGRETVLAVPMSEVLLRVRLAGHPDAIKAKLSLNGSLSIELNGAATLRIPAYVYNVTAETQWGTARQLFNASREQEVELVVYTPTDFTLALAFVAAAQLIALAVFSVRVYRARAAHRVKSDR